MPLSALIVRLGITLRDCSEPRYDCDSDISTGLLEHCLSELSSHDLNPCFRLAGGRRNGSKTPGPEAFHGECGVPDGARQIISHVISRVVEMWVLNKADSGGAASDPPLLISLKMREVNP